MDASLDLHPRSFKIVLSPRLAQIGIVSDHATRIVLAATPALVLFSHRTLQLGRESVPNGMAVISGAPWRARRRSRSHGCSHLHLVPRAKMFSLQSHGMVLLLQTTDRAKTRHHTAPAPLIFLACLPRRPRTKQRRGVTVLWLTSNVPQLRVIAQKHAAHFVIDSAEEVCQYSHIMCR